MRKSQRKRRTRQKREQAYQVSMERWRQRAVRLFFDWLTMKINEGKV